MKRWLPPSLFVVALAVFLALPWASTSAGPAPKRKHAPAHRAPAPPSTQAPSAAPAPTGPPVFTNDTLLRLFGPSGAEPAAGEEPPPRGSADAAPKLEDPLAAIERLKQEDALRRQALADAQRDLTAAEAKVVELEQRLRSERNPYLPRPKLSAEEQAAQAGLNGTDRAGRTEELLDMAKRELERARAQLASVRATP